MPEIGEIRKAHDVQRKGRGSVIWVACKQCGKERWNNIVKGNPETEFCHKCYPRKKGIRHMGKDNHNWKGGRVENKSGYIQILLEPNDFFYPMADVKGYVLEHRLVVARALNRCLLSWEIVHHKGTEYPLDSVKNKGDNRYPENLQLLNDKKYHLIDTRAKRRMSRLEKQVSQQASRLVILEAENVLLHQAINELQGVPVT